VLPNFPTSFGWPLLVVPSDVGDVNGTNAVVECLNHSGTIKVRDVRD
jgi:hypothetical protein